MYSLPDSLLACTLRQLSERPHSSYSFFSSPLIGNYRVIKWRCQQLFFVFSAFAYANNIFGIFWKNIYRNVRNGTQSTASRLYAGTLSTFWPLSINKDVSLFKALHIILNAHHGLLYVFKRVGIARPGMAFAAGAESVSRYYGYLFLLQKPAAKLLGS